jgi:hypothetical protein
MADPSMTCDAFKEALEASIHEGGDRVALPSNYVVAFQATGNPDVRYTYSGIVGLSGDLDCETGNFESFDVQADLSDDGISENAWRLIRTSALGAAALCARGKMTASQCAGAIKSLSDKAFSDFIGARDRGEEGAEGDEFRNFPNSTQVAVTYQKGAVSIDVGFRPLQP